jgi:hypothetical protein
MSLNLAIDKEFKWKLTVVTKEKIAIKQAELPSSA